MGSKYAAPVDAPRDVLGGTAFQRSQMREDHVVQHRPKDARLSESGLDKSGETVRGRKGGHGYTTCTAADCRFDAVARR
jgi:hypothetical protein